MLEGVVLGVVEVCSGVEVVLAGVEEELDSGVVDVVLAGVDEGVLESVVLEGVVDGVEDDELDEELDELGVLPPVAVPWVVLLPESPPVRSPSCRLAMALISNRFVSSQVDCATESIATATSSC